MEEHELVTVTYVDGRASKIRPGKPVFRYAFEALVEGELLSMSVLARDLMDRSNFPSI